MIVLMIDTTILEYSDTLVDSFLSDFIFLCSDVYFDDLDIDILYIDQYLLFIIYFFTIFSILSDFVDRSLTIAVVLSRYIVSSIYFVKSI